MSLCGSAKRLILMDRIRKVAVLGVVVISSIATAVFVARTGHRAEGDAGEINYSPSAFSPSKPGKGTPQLAEKPADSSADLNGRVLAGSTLERSPTHIEGTIDIYSSSGLKLERAEMGGSLDGWSELPTSGGTPILDLRLVPCDIKAPGHLAARVEKGASEVTLQPDALLTIRAPSLRSRIRSVRPLASYPDQGAGREGLLRDSCWGFVSNDEFCIATGAERWRQLTSDALDVTIELDTGYVFNCSWKPTTASRSEYVIDLDEGKAQQSAIQVSFAGANPSPGYITLLLTGPVQDSPNILPLQHITPWGCVTGYWTRADRKLEGVQFADKPSFSDLRVGQQYVISAIAPDKGDYGRVSFVHDGRPQVIQLLDGAELSGHLRLADPRDVPRPFVVTWQFLHDAGEATESIPPPALRGWCGIKRDPVIASDGSFHFSVPTAVPERLDSAWPMPTVLDVSFRVGPNEKNVIVPLNARREFDCGLIDLSPNSPSFILAPGHQLSGLRLDMQGYRVLIAHRPIEFQIARVMDRTDGGMSVFLLVDQAMPVSGKKAVLSALDMTTGEETHESWPEEQPYELVMQYAPESATCLRLAPTGMYTRVVSHEFTVSLQVNERLAGAEFLYYGWVWEGAPFRMGRIRFVDVELGHPINLTIEAPTDGAELWLTSAWQGPVASASPYLKRLPLISGTVRIP